MHGASAPAPETEMPQVFLCLLVAPVYTRAVNICLHRLSVALRAGLLALLVLGIVMQPMLASIFELHSADHVLSVETRDGQPTQDHTQGGHGLMHEGKCGGAYSDSVVALSLPIAPYPSTFTVLRMTPPVSSQHIAGPFRPPIA